MLNHPFQISESHLRFAVVLDEKDIHLIIKQYKSNIESYEKIAGIYSIHDISEVVYTMGDNEGTLKNQYNDMSVKTKPILTRFGSFFGTLNVKNRFSKLY